MYGVPSAYIRYSSCVSPFTPSSRIDLAISGNFLAKRESLAASLRVSASLAHGLCSCQSCRVYPSGLSSIHMPRQVSKNFRSSPCQSAASSTSSQSMPERSPFGRFTAAHAHRTCRERIPSSPRRRAVFFVFGCCQNPTDNLISLFITSLSLDGTPCYGHTHLVVSMNPHVSSPFGPLFPQRAFSFAYADS